MNNPSPEIQRQLEFVEWLKERGIYNEFDTAATMRKAQQVWEAMQPPESDLQPGQVFEVAYPFIKDEVQLFDEDGSYKTMAWRPGTYQEPDGPYGERTISFADGEGTMILTVVQTVTFPGTKYRERVFYTRQWRDPDGQTFGKRDLKVKGKGAFMAMAEKFRYEYEIEEAE